ncbi:MAG: cell division protein FtsQ/DivIB [Zoogloeaceae bacterium]|jgi:cell division protein FtsQ|nr:cell division protein FtsQ/DivIB [Zoogloeaceae bacterium]
MWRHFLLAQLMAAFLMIAGTAILAAAIFIAAPRLMPVRVLVLETPLHRVTPGDLREALRGRARGSFLTLPLADMRASLESLPWVRRASARRVWPDKISLLLEEQQIAARWGNSGREWVNAEGDVFAANLPRAGQALPPDLPRFSGPPGSSARLLARYAESKRLLAPIGLTPRALTLSARLALDVELSNGMRLKLGQEDALEISIARRIRRFAAAYARFVAPRQPPPASVDLRYPNGFALSPY